MPEIATEDLFAVQTPLGFTVRVSTRYWATIVAKHPASETVSLTYRRPYANRRRYDRAAETQRSSCSTALTAETDDGS